MDCTTEDNLAYYALDGLAADNDYVVESSLSNHKFTLNVCQAVKTQLWHVQGVAEDKVAAYYRGAHGDFAMGSTNSTLSVIDGNPVIYLYSGSPCPGQKEDGTRSNAAIRFICDNTFFGTGAPQLIAQFPPSDEEACSFTFEWRTHHACPAGRKPAGILHLLILFFSLVIIAILVYVVCITLYNRFFLGLRGMDQFPSLPWFMSPTRFISWIHDKLTGRGDGIVGGPPLSFNQNSTSSTRRWFGNGSGGNGGRNWFKWGRRDRNGYRGVPEEEEGILHDEMESDDEGEGTPRPVNPDGVAFDNAWANAQSRGGMNRDGIIRL